MDNALKFQKDYKKDDINQLKTDTAFSDVIKSFEKLQEERLGLETFPCLANLQKAPFLALAI